MLKLEANTASSSVIHQVLFAVKPQNTTSLFKKLHGRVPKDAVILSIIAGVPVEDYVEGLGHRKVVRSMPNTPATVRQGMTVWCCTSELCEEERDSVGRLLGTMGLQQYVSDETYLDMATAVSGSGPAYVLLVIEALIDSSVHMGFPRDMATKLVLQTVSPGHCLFGPTPLTSALACVYLMRPWYVCALVLWQVLGTTMYAMDSKKHPSLLRNDITSPGGTTASALYVLERGAFRTVLSDGVWAAYRRSLELGGQDSNVGPGRSKYDNEQHGKK